MVYVCWDFSISWRRQRARSWWALCGIWVSLKKWTRVCCLIRRSPWPRCWAISTRNAFTRTKVRRKRLHRIFSWNSLAFRIANDTSVLRSSDLGDISGSSPSVGCAGERMPSEANHTLESFVSSRWRNSDIFPTASRDQSWSTITESYRISEIVESLFEKWMYAIRDLTRSRMISTTQIGTGYFDGTEMRQLSIHWKHILFADKKMW